MLSPTERSDSARSCSYGSATLSIPRVRARASSEFLGLVLPRPVASPDHWSWCSSPSSIGQHVDTYYAVNPPVQDRRPRLSSGSGVCLELSVIEHKDCLVFERVSGRPQNSSVQGIVSWPDMTAPIFTNNWHLQPVTFVQCPCNSFNCDSITLNTLWHSFVRSFVRPSVRPSVHSFIHSLTPIRFDLQRPNSAWWYMWGRYVFPGGQRHSHHTRRAQKVPNLHLLHERAWDERQLPSFADSSVILNVHVFMFGRFCFDLTALFQRQTQQQKQAVPEAATICHRPLQVDFWPFDLESGVRVTCDVASSVPLLVFPGLSVLDSGPMYATDRQTDVRRASSLNASALWGRDIIRQWPKGKLVNSYKTEDLKKFNKSWQKSVNVTL